SRGCNAKPDFGPDGFGWTKRQTATKRSSTRCGRAVIFSSRSRGPPRDRTGVPVEHGATYVRDNDRSPLATRTFRETVRGWHAGISAAGKEASCRPGTILLAQDMHTRPEGLTNLMAKAEMEFLVQRAFPCRPDFNAPPSRDPRRQKRTERYNGHAHRERETRAVASRLSGRARSSMLGLRCYRANASSSITPFRRLMLRWRSSPIPAGAAVSSR